jgi:hypothetical protein
MTLEQANYRDQPMPDWAERERWADLAWIADNLPAFHSAASIAYEVLGRGAVVVETTYHTQDDGHPAAYFTQQELRRYEDAAIDRLVEAYTPDEELVVVLLKEWHRSSAYRVRATRPEPDARTIAH